MNDVVQKLAPRYDKGVVQSMLDALERQGVLRSKAVVAQQKAYWPDQSKIKATSMADIRDMSCDVRDAKCDAKEADEDASKLERRAERLYRSPPTMRWMRPSPRPRRRLRTWSAPQAREPGASQ